jgi:hypothetical protein
MKIAVCCIYFNPKFALLQKPWPVPAKAFVFLNQSGSPQRKGIGNSKIKPKLGTTPILR